MRVARLVRRLGAALLFVGLACFAWAALAGGQRFERGTWDALVAQGAVPAAHREALRSALAPIEGRYHASTSSFVAEVGRRIDEAGAALDAPDRIGDHERSTYVLQIAYASASGGVAGREGAWMLGSLALASLGGLLFGLAGLGLDGPGIRNDGTVTSRLRSRGWVGVLLGMGLVGFYVALYFFPAHIVGWIRLAEPASQALRGRPADRWFFYGLLYTLAVLVMGVRMLVRYRHSRYHVVRTASVMFFQLGFAFLVPSVLAALGRPEHDFKNIWPLDYSFFFGYRLDGYLSAGPLGWFILLWGLALALVVVPVFAWLFGKRWYCSWVCGCGGLAETLGDPFRHLSDKRLGAWRVERWSVHAVLVFAVAMTAVVLVNYVSGRSGTPLLGEATWRLQSWYGFLIGSIFAGVVGTGFYPLMGNRVWCRFGCPLAAVLGLVQRFRSRFRITTNGGQCISCGNCSTYCEMGIDVRWYAQRGDNVVRASCVGCGVCAEVCPRGVLRLENGPPRGRLVPSPLARIGTPAQASRRRSESTSR